MLSVVSHDAFVLMTAFLCPVLVAISWRRFVVITADKVVSCQVVQSGCRLNVGHHHTTLKFFLQMIALAKLIVKA